MERRVLLLIALAVALGLTVYGLRHRQKTLQTQINRFTFAKIQDGMTQAAVEELLGVPPGNYSTVVTAVRGTWWRAPHDARLEEWWSDAGVIRVAFGRDDTVGGKEFLEVETDNGGWVRRALNWIGL
jgi:hypothetical protein